MRAMCLSAVFNHFNPAAASYAHDGIHIGWMSIQMDRHYSLGLISYRRADLCGIDAVGLRIAVHKHRSCTDMRYRSRSGNERIGRDKNLITRTNTQSL